MAANTAPRFTNSGDVGSDASTGMAPTFTTAAADYDGTTATHNKLVFTADPTNGSRLVGIRFKAKGTNTGSVARIFLNNGSVNTSAANNSFVGELTLPGTTASNIVSTPDMDFIFPGGYVDLPAGYRVYAGLATTVVAGWVATPILGGKF